MLKLRNKGYPAKPGFWVGRSRGTDRTMRNFPSERLPGVTQRKP